MIAVLRDSNSILRSEILVSVDEARELDERVITDAIAFRKSVGMRADEVWVRTIQNDPRAVYRYGVAMSEEEADAIDRRIKTQLEIAPAVEAYGLEHGDEWAGTYIDQSTGVLVASVTGHVEEHTNALLALFAPGVARIEVRMVRWSTAELDQFNAPIWEPAGQAALKELGATVVGGGARVVENDVVLEVAVPAADPALAGRIVSHFNGTGWLTVKVSVNPAMVLPFGALEITVLDETGNPAIALQCWLIPDVAGAGGDSTIRDTEDDGVCRWDAIHATGYDIEIRRRQASGVIGRGRVTVPANGTGRVTVTATGE